jgi:hypothetical protein
LKFGENLQETKHPIKACNICNEFATSIFLNSLAQHFIFPLWLSLANLAFSFLKLAKTIMGSFGFLVMLKNRKFQQKLLLKNYQIYLLGVLYSMEPKM